MSWSTNISIGDLHYLRSKFAQWQGLDGVYLNSFVKATEAFYLSSQFRANENYFITWAFLTPEMEVDYCLGNFNWLDNMANGSPWIIEAYMPKNARSAMRELRHLIPSNTLRFKRGEKLISSIYCPDLTK